MKRTEIESLLRDHLRGVHEELATLFHGVERTLDQHLERTESIIADSFADQDSPRLLEIERRLAQLEKTVGMK